MGDTNSDMIEVIGALDVPHAMLNYGQYAHWASQFGEEPLPERRAGRLDMTPVEQKWVVMDALRRQLAGNGFCPTFEQVVEPICEGIFQRVPGVDDPGVAARP
jgi:hypothetical protein